MKALLAAIGLLITAGWARADTVMTDVETPRSWKGSFTCRVVNISREPYAISLQIMTADGTEQVNIARSCRMLASGQACEIATHDPAGARCRLSSRAPSGALRLWSWSGPTGVPCDPSVAPCSPYPSPIPGRG